jgi:hypothetical protein
MTETLFRLRVPLEIALLAFALLLAWMGVRRSD